MPKSPKDPVREYLSRLGRKGAKATLRKYGKRQLREWGKLGGRPPKKRKK